MSNELILDPNGVLVVPCASGKPIAVDLRDVIAAEARGHELKGVNILKAPELLYTFSRALHDTEQMIGHLRGRALNQCKRAIDTRRAIVILDEAKGILEKKGLATSRTPGGSADLREAVVAVDAEYLRLHDILDQIEAAIESLKIKAEEFKRLYFSVQKVVDPRARDHYDTSGGAGAADVGENDVPPLPKRIMTNEDNEKPNELDLSGFGEAKY